MEDNTMNDTLMIEATATLYAMEHEEIVKGNFDRLYDLMVKSFDDEAFRERLTNLRPGGTVTIGIVLKPKNGCIMLCQQTLV